MILASGRRAMLVDRAFHTVFFLCALLSTLSVCMIAIYIFAEGLPALREIGVVNFVTGRDWVPPVYFGILPMIAGTLLSTLGAILVAMPMGVLTAVWLAELAPARVVAVLGVVVELMAGIPSIVYGFFGLVVIVPVIEQSFALPAGQTLLAGIVVLVMMLLPTIVTLTRHALQAVPAGYRETSIALGASPIFTIMYVVIPAARSGIMTAMIFSITRAVGETMAMIMVMGNAPAMLSSLLGPARTLTANIALEMSYASGLHSSALYATGVVLLVVIMVLNILMLYLNKKRVFRV